MKTRIVKKKNNHFEPYYEVHKSWFTLWKFTWWLNVAWSDNVEDCKEEIDKIRNVTKFKEEIIIYPEGQ